MKKLLIGFGALALALVVMPMFAAFEAHVVNVTATIENALSVPVKPIQFGTVFPQETLAETLDITLSQSFKDQNRVDQVSYFIRQKPKCAWSWQINGVWNIDQGSTQSGHVDDAGVVTCPDAVNVPENPNGTPPTGDGIPDNATWGQLPLLCPYISKHSEAIRDTQGNIKGYEDGALNSFHQPWTVVPSSSLDWNDVDGTLTTGNDETDTWTIDLAVPCFGGFCAQDWAQFVKDVSGDQNINPSLYTQSKDNEHKVFGCDLWVEVSDVISTATE
mgnify:CR=1 FL=1